jgi:hypothetical protein
VGGGGAVFQERKYIIVLCFDRMVHIIAEEFLTDERDRKYYADNYTCCPPPLFILFITLVEVRLLKTKFINYYHASNEFHMCRIKSLLNSTSTLYFSLLGIKIHVESY